MKLTYYGHSCFNIALASGARLLIDPFITPNEKAKNIQIELIEADYILVSHAHFDHIADLEMLARKTQAPVIAVWEIHQWLQEKGISHTVPMNVGGKYSLKEGGYVQLIPAAHSSSFPDGRYGGVPVGFLLCDEERTVYYSGDTSLIAEMDMIGQRYELDAAILCIGGTFTMDPSEAAEAAEYLGVEKVIGMHFDTFPPITINHEKTYTLFQERDIELTLPTIGANYIV